MKIGFMLDPLAFIMLVVVISLGSIVLCYSQRYLLSDTTRTRFIFQMMLTIGSVIAFIMASNLLTAFVAWQWIGFNLYLLLNHYHYQSDANRAAKKKFIINRIGDICFLVAIILCYQLYSTSEYHELALITSKQLKILSFNLNAHSLILCLVFVAIMTKSAQFPFHFWLPDTMQTPTPVSALMHAGVINAGGILLARLSGVFTQVSLVPYIILCVGLSSMLVGSLFKQLQSDIKKKLAYSTMGQMGYMLIQSALGCFAAAVFHLIAHGFYKAALFLNAGDDLFAENNHTKNDNTFNQFIQSALLTFIIFSLAFLAFRPNQTSLLIATFIGITLHQMINTVIKNHELVDKIIILTVIQAILIGYFGLLNLFEFWLEIPKLALINKNFEFILCAITIVLYLASSFNLTLAKAKSNWVKKLRYHVIKLLQIETQSRRYILKPIRLVGDWLNLFLFENSVTKYFSIAALLLVPALIFAKMASYIPSSICNYLLMTELVLCLLMANRAKNLFDLVLLLSITHINLLAISYNNLKIPNLELTFCLLSVFMGLLWLLSQSTYSRQNRQQSLKNRLSLFGTYLAISLFLIVGIPGTASFIFWLNLLSSATSNMPMIIGLMFANILLAVTVLHTLQDHVFNLQETHEINSNRKIQAHIIFVSIIFCNIYFGLFSSNTGTL
ncbi:MAG: proton-conducting transporter membrane subunit [Candidatus Berkiella sp.]